MEMSTEPKTVKSQAPKTTRIGSEFVIKPSKFRIIIELDEGQEIDPMFKNDLDHAIEDLATAVQNATHSSTPEEYELLPGEF